MFGNETQSKVSQLSLTAKTLYDLNNSFFLHLQSRQHTLFKNITYLKLTNFRYPEIEQKKVTSL